MDDKELQGAKVPHVAGFPTAQCFPLRQPVRVAHQLVRMLTLCGQASQMNLACSSAPSLLSFSTRTAHDCLRPHVAFCALIPPLLLRLCPDLFHSAALAVERHLQVVTALHEIGRSVTIGGAKILWVYQDMLLGQISQFACLFPFALLSEFNCLRAAFDATSF